MYPPMRPLRPRKPQRIKKHSTLRQRIKESQLATAMVKLRQRIKERPVATMMIALLAAIFILITLCILGYIFKWEWTGLTPFTTPPHPANTGFQPGKTLWDWLQLLIIPVVLAVSGYIINFTISRNEQEAIKQRDKTEHSIDSNRLQESVLKEYLDKMSELLLRERLRESKPEDEVRKIAHTQTMVALQRLDGYRKGRALQFLYEAGLINKGRTIVDLSGAPLSHTKLLHGNLQGANLQKVHLLSCDLHGANLHGADLSGARLGASFVQLQTGKEVERFFQTTSEVRPLYNDGSQSEWYKRTRREIVQHYRQPPLDLIEARHPVIEQFFRYETTDLFQADLSEANLTGVNFDGANMTEVNLMGANLTGATLAGVSLFRAKVTNEQLEKVKILHEIIMPDGSAYPDTTAGDYNPE